MTDPETLIGTDFLLRIIAEIRAASGVGDKPMLTELAGAIAAMRDDLRDKLIAALRQRDAARAEVKKMREAIVRAATQLQQRDNWDSHLSGTWQILNDALSPAPAKEVMP